MRPNPNSNANPELEEEAQEALKEYCGRREDAIFAILDSRRAAQVTGGINTNMDSIDLKHTGIERVKGTPEAATKDGGSKPGTPSLEAMTWR